MNVVVSPKRVAQVLTAIAFLLALASITGQIFRYFLGRERLLGLVSLFNMNYENNIPTVYSALLLLLSSTLLVLIALGKQQIRNRFTTHWWTLAILFLYLSFDELFEIHESINSSLGKELQLWQAGSWDILNPILISVIVLAYTKFFLHLPPKIQRLFLASGSLFVLGAVGIELLSKWYFSNIYNQVLFMAEVVTTVEELLEMVGIIIFIHTTLIYIGSYLGGVNIRIGKPVSAIAQELPAQPNDRFSVKQTNN